MFCNKKTAKWLLAKSDDERSAVLNIARKSAQDARVRFRARQEELSARRREILLRREKEIIEKHQKELEKEEELTDMLTSLQIVDLWATGSAVVLGSSGQFRVHSCCSESLSSSRGHQLNASHCIKDTAVFLCDFRPTKWRRSEQTFR